MTNSEHLKEENNTLLTTSCETFLTDQFNILTVIEKKLCSFESKLVELEKGIAKNKAFLTEIGEMKYTDQIVPDVKKHIYIADQEFADSSYHISKHVDCGQCKTLKEEIVKLKATIEKQRNFISWLKTEVDQKTKTIYYLQKLLTVQQNIPHKSQPTYDKPVLSLLTKNKKGLSYRKGFINLGEQLTVVFGKHRSGWKYAIAHLSTIHREDGIYLDAFIERTFIWKPGQIVPTLQPWIGFIHVPPNVPDWFQCEQSNDAVFATDAWKKSYPYCKGLYTLSEYHKKALEKKLDVPINVLLHPTEEPKIKWQWEKFEKNSQKKIVQIGWWLRKLHAIFELPKSNYKKVFLRVTNERYFMKLFEIERKIRKANGNFNESMYETAEIIDYLPDEDYDKLLSENIAFADLYDSSANNLIIECIVRNVPLLVNPLEAVVEYLGKDYPFYFTNYDEAVAKACDLDLVYQTHQYLKNHEIKKKLSGDYFLESFKNSEIFRNL